MTDQVAEGRHVMDGPDVWDRYIAARLEEAAALARGRENKDCRLLRAGLKTGTPREDEEEASVASQGGAGG